MADLLIARRSAVVGLGGTPHRVRRGRTIAHRGHPIVEQYPDLWRPVPVDYDLDPEVELGQPAPAPAGPDRPAARAPRDAWDAYAAELGLNPEAVAALSSKADVVALVDQVEAGVVVIGTDGQAVDVTAPEG